MRGACRLGAPPPLLETARVQEATLMVVHLLSSCWKSIHPAAVDRHAAACVPFRSSRVQPLWHARRDKNEVPLAGALPADRHERYHRAAGRGDARSPRRRGRRPPRARVLGNEIAYPLQA